MPIRYATADTFRVITRKQLEPILDVLTSITWPCPEDHIPHIINQLGWVITSQRVNIRADTQLPFNYTSASFGSLEGEFSRLGVPVSDTVDENDVTGVTRVEESFSTIGSYIESILVLETKRTDSAPSHAWWDLPTGGRIRLDNIIVGLQLRLLSQRLADVERYEETHDMSEYDDE